MRTSLTYIPALTGVRALAAYLVFFHHFNPLPVQTWGWRMVNEGHIGVTMFFVLSGFLIPLRYADKVILSRQWLKQYFKNRFSRIYPLYALLTLATFVASSFNSSFGPWKQYNLSDKIIVPLLNFTFLRGFFDQFKFTGIGQGWTLTVEECFYAFAPLLLLTLAKSRMKYRLLAVFTISLIAIGCGLVEVMPHKFGFLGSYHFVFYRTFFGRAFEFMLGAALAIFIRQYYKARPGAWATSIGLAWIIGSMIALCLIASKQIPSWENPIGIALNNLWLPIGVALFFYGLLTEQTWLGKLLGTSIAQTLGKSSYAFYLVHIGIVSLFLEHYVTSNVFVLFGVALILAYILWKWIEEPLNHWLRGSR
jgi:peptidoglycan/LPS O-acetylase OafA/YrhL